ncbi:hypothetical protein N9F08_00565 [bacterium]|nr:hypothetical protein [bacterium]
MKNLIKNADVLNKEEQKAIQGGFFGNREPHPVCHDPYYDPSLSATDHCLPGYFMFPQSVGICCKWP